MREYRFRGKAKATGEWVYGDLTHERYGTCIQYIIKKMPTGYGAPERETITERHKTTVDPETIGQYTEMPDKNGKEIYEGDIVAIGETKKEYCEVAFRYGSFGILAPWIDKGDNFVELINYCNEVFEGTIEVIGNKWENPELLKEVE